MNREEVVIFNAKNYRITGLSFEEWQNKLLEERDREIIEKIENIKWDVRLSEQQKLDKLIDQIKNNLNK